MNIAQSLTLALVLSAAPAVAQISGSINRDAPTVSHSITFKNQAKIEVSYTAIAFGKGAWQSILENKDGHDRFNQAAAGKPIGSVNTTSAISAYGKVIPAGDYDLFFTARSFGERSAWLVNLKNKGDANAELITWGLGLKDSDVNHARMMLTLEPGAESDAMNLTIAFGNKIAVLGLGLSDGAPAKEASSKPSKGN